MKKRISVIFIILLALLFAFTLLACAQQGSGGENGGENGGGTGEPDKPNRIKLDAPTVTLGEDGVARWNYVEYATEYLMEFNGEECGVTQDNNANLDYGDTFRVKAIATEKYEGESNWSNRVTREDKAAETLFPPEPYLDGERVRWGKIDGAIRYEIEVDGSVYTLGENETDYYLEVNQTARIRAIGDGRSYSDSIWSYFVTRKGDDNPDIPQDKYQTVTGETRINDMFVAGLYGDGDISVIKKNKDGTAISVDGEPLELYQRANSQGTYYYKKGNEYVVFCENWPEKIDYNDRQYYLARKVDNLAGVESWYRESDVESGEPFSVNNVGKNINSEFTFLDKTFTLYQQDEKGEDGKKVAKLLVEDKDGNYSIATHSVEYNEYGLYIKVEIEGEVYCNGVGEVPFEEKYRGDYVTESGKVDVARVKNNYIVLNDGTLGSFTIMIKGYVYVVIDNNFVRTVFNEQYLTLGAKTYKKPTKIAVEKDSAYEGMYIFDDKNFIKVSSNKGIFVNGTQKAQIMTLSENADLFAVFVRGEYEVYDRYDYERITLDENFVRGESTYFRAQKVSTTTYTGAYKKSENEFISVSSVGDMSYGGETYEIFTANGCFYGVNDKIIALSLSENEVRINDNATYAKITLTKVVKSDLGSQLHEKNEWNFYCITGTNDNDKVSVIYWSYNGGDELLINYNVDNAIYKDESGKIVATQFNGEIYPFSIEKDTNNEILIKMNQNPYYAMRELDEQEKEKVTELFRDKRFYQIPSDSSFHSGTTILFAENSKGEDRGFYSDSAIQYLGGENDKTALERDYFILSKDDEYKGHVLMRVGDYYCLTRSMNDRHDDLFFKVDENGNIDGVGKNNDYGIVKPLRREQQIDNEYLGKAYNKPYERIEWVERGNEYFELKANVSTAFRGTPNPYNSTISYVYYVGKDGKTIYLRNNYAPIVTEYKSEGTIGDYRYFQTTGGDKQYFLRQLEPADGREWGTNDYDGQNSGTMYYRAKLTELQPQDLKQVALVGHYYKAYRETCLETYNGGTNYVYMDLAINSFEKNGISLICDSSIDYNRNKSRYTYYELVDAYYYDLLNGSMQYSAERMIVMTFKDASVGKDSYRTFEFTFNKKVNFNDEIDKTRMSYNPFVRVSKKNVEVGGTYEWWSSEWKGRNPSSDINEFKYRSGELKPVDDFDVRLGVYGYLYADYQKLGNSDFYAKLSDLYSIIKTADGKYKFVFNGVSNIYAGYTNYTNNKHSYELASYDLYTDGDQYYWGKVNNCLNGKDQYVIYGELSFDDNGLTLVDYFGEDREEYDEHGIKRYPVDKTTQLTVLKEIAFDENKINYDKLYTYGMTGTDPDRNEYKTEKGVIFTSASEALTFDYNSRYIPTYPGHYDNQDEKRVHKVKFYIHDDDQNRTKRLVYVVPVEENVVVAKGVLATVDAESGKITEWKWYDTGYAHEYSKTNVPVREDVRYFNRYGATDITLRKDGKVDMDAQSFDAEYYVRSYEETVGESATATTYYDYIVLIGGEQIRIEKATIDGENNVVIPELKYYKKNGKEDSHLRITKIEFSGVIASGTYKEKSERERTIKFDTTANTVTVKDLQEEEKKSSVIAAYKFNLKSETKVDCEVSTTVYYVDLLIELSDGNGIIIVDKAIIDENGIITLPDKITYENSTLELVSDAGEQNE